MQIFGSKKKCAKQLIYEYRNFAFTFRNLLLNYGNVVKIILAPISRAIGGKYGRKFSMENYQ